MGNLLVILFLAVCVNIVYADRVCIQKSTGKFIEYQSGNISDTIDTAGIPDDQKEDFITNIKKMRIDALKNNAVQAGYAPSDIEVKEITKEEWETIKNEQILAPILAAKAAEEADREAKETQLRTKLNLTKSDMAALKQIMK